VVYSATLILIDTNCWLKCCYINVTRTSLATKCDKFYLTGSEELKQSLRDLNKSLEDIKTGSEDLPEVVSKLNTILNRFDSLVASRQEEITTILENVFSDEEGEDDIIVIQDSESFIRGKPLEFRILRMNRIPAMIWFNETRLHEFVFYPMGLCEDLQTMAIAGSDFDIDWAEDTRSNALEWHSKLEAADPDEDNLVFVLYPEDGKVDPVVPGADFPIKVCVTDTGEAEDCQSMMLRTRACPIPE